MSYSLVDPKEAGKGETEAPHTPADSATALGIFVFVLDQLFV